MSDKLIILKNTTQSAIKINDLGIIIVPNQSSTSNYSDVLYLKESVELRNLIESGSLVVNDGTNDLTVENALIFLNIVNSPAYYTKAETNALINNTENNITVLQNTISDVYYSKSQIDTKIVNIQTNGIKGAVNYYTDLPSEGNIEGDIWIVRYSEPHGAGPKIFTPTGNTGMYLPFDNTWQDTLGHQGSASSGFTYQDGVLGKAIDFSNNKAITFNSNADFGQGTTLTVGGWIYTRRTGTYGIISRWSDDDDGEGWKIEVHGNKLRVHIDTPYAWDGGADITDSYKLETNKWQHIAFVYTGGNITLYKNAIPINNTTTPQGNIDSNNLPVIIGKNYDDNAQYFDGMMDDWFIENRAMSRDDLEELVYGNVQQYFDEGFYKWNGTEWIFLSRNTGDDVSNIVHDDTIGLNTGNYQHLTQDEKSQLFFNNTNTTHNHNDVYYTKTETTNNFSEKSHAHDDIYYTKTQVDNLESQITYTTISNNDQTTNVTGAELETLTNGSNADGLHTHSFSDVITGKTLDDAYNGYNKYGRWGEGRIINADYGPVEIRPTSGYAPLKLTPSTATPTQWLAGGEIFFKDNEIWFRDASRAKFLSMAILTANFSINANTTSGYFYYGPALLNSLTGYSMPWSGTIVGVSGTCQNNSNSSFGIRINGSTSFTGYWGTSTHMYLDNLSVDIEAGDAIQIYGNNGSTNPTKPCVTLFIRKRII